MNQLILPVNFGTLPAGFCPTDYQSLGATFAGISTVTFPTTFSGVFVSTSPPTDTTAYWIQIDSLGRPTRGYAFAQGKWLSLHPIVPRLTMIWVDALPDFTTFDGGDGNAAGPASGPMWQQAQTTGGALVLQAQFPIGVGTLPSAGVVAVGQTGGEELHILSVDEMPPHVHSLPQIQQQLATGNNQNYLTLQGNAISPITTTSTGGDPTTGPPPTSAKGHNNVPPFYGVYFLQRSGRLYYAV